MPHLATTYAAINALITVGGHKSLSSINRWSIHSILWPLHPILCQLFSHLNPFLGCREKMYAFLLRMKDASGGFRYCTIFLCVLLDSSSFNWRRVSAYFKLFHIGALVSVKQCQLHGDIFLVHCAMSHVVVYAFKNQSR